eukprot:TRINITY_DN4053_c0_g1_i1.p1 TRINITY_DN4053_c0_g1~~TRINITY_DN4053_c0_g1_i1.p1  ORF type:complete len:137 (-),score=24.93 TRINITY_DN4053_c0_g1_i1:41-451(-)
MTSGTPLLELERGALPARINFLAFNPDATILVLTSQTGTVHVFNLETPDQGLSSWMSISAWRGRTSSVVKFNIPESESICSIPSTNKKTKESEIILLSKSPNNTESLYYKYLYRDDTKTVESTTLQYILKEDIITT